MGARISANLISENTIMWQAQPRELAQLEKVFKATLSRDSAERTQANDFLAHARLLPEFENYLCELLVSDNLSHGSGPGGVATGSGGVATEVRAAAGLQLKNSILKDPAPAREYVKATIFQGLVLHDALARNITGNVITQLFSAQGVEAWPQALAQLLLVADGSDRMQEKVAAVSALAKICEDSSAAIDRDISGQRPLDHIVARLLAVCQGCAADPSAARLKEQVVTCLNHIVPLKLQLLLVHMDEYLRLLFLLAMDESKGVRKNVCTAFLLIRELHPDMLVPHLRGVIAYCVQSVEAGGEDETVALEACEFLLALAELKDKAETQVLQPALVQVVPVLLLHMVYSEELILLIEVLDSSSHQDVADRDEDVRPNMVKAKDAHKPRAQAVEAASDELDDLDAEEELDQWNLRRCCAATLDALLLSFPQEVINVSLPILQDRIVSADWATREAAILAFGAISKSCIELAPDKLPSLVPFLVDRMKDAEPRVRQITCWTLSRYTEWVAEEAHEGGQYCLYFQPTFEAMVGLTLDEHKIVQEAACSALSSFIENTEPSLLEYYVGPLLEQFARCFAVYQRKNLIMLYECVTTFVDQIGPEIFSQRSEYAGTLLPPLLKNWHDLADDDTDLWPLLQCIASVAVAMGEAFAPYAVPVFQRAVKILGHTVEMNQLMHTDPLIEAPEKAFMVTALDLISGLMQGFQSHSHELLSHDAHFMPLVLTCLEDHDDDVRQLAYALLGDLTMYTFSSFVQPHLARIIQCVGNEVHNCSYSTYPAANNAVWCLGEIALQVNAGDLEPYLANLVALLVPLLNSDAELMLLQNAAICLGRLGLAIAAGNMVLACRLPEVIFSWCSQMNYVFEDNEKDSAFLGMARTISLNPDEGMGQVSTSQGRKNLASFFTCIARYESPSEDLKSLFFLLVSSYKALLGSAWGEVLALVNDLDRGCLCNLYGA